MRGTSDTTTGDAVLHARGGLSPLAIVTGILVALGVMTVLAALVGGAVAASDVNTTGEAIGEVGRENLQEAGIAAAVVLVMAQFLAYLWGGYTAGRMGRGSGFTNGLLVPLGALLVGSVVVAVASAMGTDTTLNLPFFDARLPVDDDVIVRSSLALGIASLAAMLVGGIVGGIRGARWHDRLEDRRADGIDLRDRPVVVDDGTVRTESDAEVDEHTVTPSGRRTRS